MIVEARTHTASPIRRIPIWRSEVTASRLQETALDTRATSSTVLSNVRPKADATFLFQQLVDWWRRDTEGLSSPSEKAAHPAYQLIIQMGDKVVPFILADLKEHGGDWYIALRKITNARPVSVGTSRNTADVVAAWLQWGRDNRYIR